MYAIVPIVLPGLVRCSGSPDNVAIVLVGEEVELEKEPSAQVVSKARCNEKEVSSKEVDSSNAQGSEQGNRWCYQARPFDRKAR